MNVTNNEDITTAHKQIKNRLKENDILFGLVNNAGVSRSSEFEWDRIENFTTTMDVNIIGMIKVTREFLPLLREGNGRIVNVASLAARLHCPDSISYSISKHAVVGFSDNLRREMFKFGVKVISIEPWFYSTNMMQVDFIRKNAESAWENTPEGIKQDYGETYFQKTVRMLESASSVTCPKIDKVTKSVILALTTYDPDPRYIVAPFVLVPFIRICEYIPTEWYDWGIYIHSWFCGTHKPYPQKKTEIICNV